VCGGRVGDTSPFFDLVDAQSGSGFEPMDELENVPPSFEPVAQGLDDREDVLGGQEGFLKRILEIDQRLLALKMAQIALLKQKKGAGGGGGQGCSGGGSINEESEPLEQPDMRLPGDEIATRMNQDIMDEPIVDEPIAGEPLITDEPIADEEVDWTDALAGGANTTQNATSIPAPNASDNQANATDGAVAQTKTEADAEAAEAEPEATGEAKAEAAAKPAAADEKADQKEDTPLCPGNKASMKSWNQCCQAFDKKGKPEDCKQCSDGRACAMADWSRNGNGKEMCKPKCTREETR
jgi:hypothetical protein